MPARRLGQLHLHDNFQNHNRRFPLLAGRDTDRDELRPAPGRGSGRLCRGCARWAQFARSVVRAGSNVTEILGIHFVECRQVRQIIQVDVGGHDLVEIHVGFFKVVEKIAHGLPELMGGGRGVDAAVRSRNEAALGGAIQECRRQIRRDSPSDWAACSWDERPAFASDHARPRRCTRCGRHRAGSILRSSPGPGCCRIRSAAHSAGS